MMSIVKNMLNKKTNRFHPIVFRWAPLPGPQKDGIPIRYKSQGHHTEGFDTREESIKECELMVGRVNRMNLGKAQLSVEEDLEWNGEGIPAMIIFVHEIRKKV